MLPKNMPNFSSHSLLVLLVALYLCCTSYATSSSDDFLGAECLNVPAAEFVGSLRTTIDAVRKVTSIVSQLGGFFGDFRLSNAISDCLDLLDFSADELSWTLSASQNPKGTLLCLSSLRIFLFLFLYLLLAFFLEKV